MWFDLGGWVGGAVVVVVKVPKVELQAPQPPAEDQRSSREEAATTLGYFYLKITRSFLKKNRFARWYGRSTFF